MCISKIAVFFFFIIINFELFQSLPSFFLRSDSHTCFGKKNSGPSCTQHNQPDLFMKQILSHNLKVQTRGQELQALKQNKQKYIAEGEKDNLDRKNWQDLSIISFFYHDYCIGLSAKNFLSVFFLLLIILFCIKQ